MINRDFEYKYGTDAHLVLIRLLSMLDKIYGFCVTKGITYSDLDRAFSGEKND